MGWNYKKNSAWNCTARPVACGFSTTNSNYNKHLCSNRKYSLSDLLDGTVFICDDGWQFRVEIFNSENAPYTGKSPPMHRIGGAYRYLKMTLSNDNAL